ncbi:M48 family metallopeptidase [Acinetobacter stercoris]|uniref:Metalloprotease LoiP n=1 Tax=Acinetobacter stercoris TaxID=2126983 RepID=A0A2U3N3U1_9GAMM|nr:MULTISPECIES: M48 family metallopeptidase [Acinetobacter]SPL72360.1 Metalloprotease LoiP precursor [Acinetobacter stercoris]
MKKSLLLGACVASILSFSGCTTIADMAGADSATLNLSAAQGFNKTVQEAQANKTLDTSSSTYRKINNVFKRMTPYADQMNQTGQKFTWQLAVLKSDTVNAYVAPGGKVVFYTGIVNKLNLTDDEIAAVMGHEMTHALEEHSKQKLGAQALTNLAVGIGKSYVGSAGGGLGGAALDLGSQIGVGLPYSRNLENRADYGGLMLMARAGYNPQAAITLWEKMGKLGGAKGSALLSTHPTDSSRIEAMRKNLPAAMQVYNSRK